MKIETVNELIRYLVEELSISEQDLDMATDALDHAYFKGESEAYQACLNKLEELLT